MHGIKVTIQSIWKCTVQGIKYIHVATIATIHLQKLRLLKLECHPVKQ